MPKEPSAFMRLALEEGRKALPACLPNPPVGCVLVRDDRIIATGYTQPPFDHHAEAMALSRVEGELSDVTAFVTLEPCSFHGRTPSCAQALVNRHVRRVWVALIDPDLRNSGEGIRLLQNNGVEVITGLLANEALGEIGRYLAKTSNGRRDG